MYKLNTRDHFNCSLLLFAWPAPRNRCGQTERGGLKMGTVHQCCGHSSKPVQK